MGRSGRTSGSTCGPKWGQCDNSEVGQSSAKFDLREALDSLQDDIELSSLAGTNGNTCGLKTKRKRKVSVNPTADQKHNLLILTYLKKTIKLLNKNMVVYSPAIFCIFSSLFK